MSRSAAVLSAAAVLLFAQPVGTVATSSCTGRDLTITFTNYGYVPRANAFRIEIFQDASGMTPLLVVDRAQNDLSPVTARLSGAKSARRYNIRGLYTTGGGNTWAGQPLPGATVSV